MAHSPISRPDPFDPGEPNSVRENSGVDEASEASRAHSLSQWVNTLSACGGGSLAADLALDLVLNDIGERARTATKAAAAAIALARNGEFVCRATTGENAPGLGVPLDTQSGLSAACLQTGKWQRCEDTELDDRVDPELCRRLGVRSILVFPILNKQELLGLIEIFGSGPRAFSSREVGTLERLAREVVESVDRVAAIQATSPVPGPESIPDASLESLHPANPAKKERDLWTDILSLLVIALAVILGWVVGRAGWRSAMTNFSPRGKQVTQSRGVPASDVVLSPAGAQGQEESTGTPRAGNGSGSAAEPASGLTVYQNGRVVFRAPARSQKEEATSGAPPSAAPPSAAPSSAGPATGSAVPPLRISPEIASEYVLRRVEPDYPEAARESRIQGTVVIDVIVGQDGEVEKLISIRGDAQLVAAASNAIRQWRFQPFFRNGRPERIQTRITMDFRLP